MLSRGWTMLALLASGFIGAGLMLAGPLARAAAVPVHFTSHQLCSAAFVGGLEPAIYFDQAIKPKQRPLAALMRHEMDAERREVRVSLAGLLHSRAVYDGAFGCRVLRPGQDIRFDQGETRGGAGQSAQPRLAPPGPIEAANAELARALENAFQEDPSAPPRFTQAVVVLHRGRIVGERYAEGVTPSTPLIGWSMTKAATNALLGILVRKGLIDMHAPAPVPEWKPGDPRAAITPDQLLRMVSGLSCGDSLRTSGFATIFDPDTQMEFDIGDQAVFAASVPLRRAPGTAFGYTNCNYILLSRIIRDLAGGDPESVRAFVDRELFAPVGMTHATLEYDIAGVPLGTVHLWASARDWARFGQLYLRDGIAEGGERILPEGWVAYSAELTPESAPQYGFGAGFWTQRGDSAAARARIEAGFPADSFMAVGSQGQYTIVIPSLDLVIVKIGWAYTPNDDQIAVARLVREVVAALPRAS